jgi:hypothetical protein
VSAGEVENPFCTARVRPGAIPFAFPTGQTAAALVARLGAQGWRGQIIGPHGSGKSTLVASLILELARHGRRPFLVELHDGQRRLPVDLRRVPGLDSTAVVIVDGYEQLAFLPRLRLRWFCRRQGLGLLVTSHTSVGLPELYATSTTAGQACELAAHLLGPEAALIRPEEVAERFARHEGDLREVLFDLYDLYEQRRRGGQ